MKNLLEQILQELRILNKHHTVTSQNNKILNLQHHSPTEPTATTQAGDDLPPLAQIWNSYAHSSLNRIIACNKTSIRYQNAILRYKENPRESYWMGVIKKLNESKFCLGDNEAKWKCDFDWLCKPDVAIKILEGKYDNRTSAQKEKRICGYITNENGQSIPIYEEVK